MLNLPENVVKLIENNEISPGHAKILVGLENAYFLAKKIIDKNLSVRQSENLVRLLRSDKKYKPSVKDSNITNLESILREKTGLNIFVKNKKNNSGSVLFEYRDLDQLNRIIKTIKDHY